MRLIDLKEQFIQDNDLPLLIRNLLVYLDNYRYAKSEINQLTNILVYKTTNKNLPYYKWWDFTDVSYILQSLTGYNKSLCDKELRRCTSTHAVSPAELHIKTFYLGQQAKKRIRYMIRTNSPLDKITGKRTVFKRCEKTGNIILCNE